MIGAQDSLGIQPGPRFGIPVIRLDLPLPQDFRSFTAADDSFQLRTAQLGSWALTPIIFPGTAPGSLAGWRKLT